MPFDVAVAVSELKDVLAEENEALEDSDELYAALKRGPDTASAAIGRCWRRPRTCRTLS